MKTEAKGKLVQLKLTLEEIVCIRGNIGGELDLIDEELDDSRNSLNPDISRTKMLNRQILLDNILQKVNKSIQSHQRTAS